MRPEQNERGATHYKNLGVIVFPEHTDSLGGQNIREERRSLESLEEEGNMAVRLGKTQLLSNFTLTLT